MDLALDSNDGSMVVLFSNGDVLKFYESEIYSTGHYLFTTVEGCDRIDISPDGNIITGGNASGTLTYAATHAPDGELIKVYDFEDPDGGLKEVMGSTATIYENHHCFIAPYSVSGYTWLGTFIPPDYHFASWGLAPNQIGSGHLYYDLILGAVTSSNSWWVYILEDDPEFHVERYNITLNYQDVTFGGYGNGAGNFHDPIDIARDKYNYYYVLDRHQDGTTRIKRFDQLGGTKGQVNCENTISGDPLRIEGSDYNGNIFVLHSEGLSIFFENEL